jgi:hypothetical protein
VQFGSTVASVGGTEGDSDGEVDGPLVPMDGAKDGLEVVGACSVVSQAPSVYVKISKQNAQQGFWYVTSSEPHTL